MNERERQEGGEGGQGNKGLKTAGVEGERKKEMPKKRVVDEALWTISKLLRKICLDPLFEKGRWREVLNLRSS